MKLLCGKCGSITKVNWVNGEFNDIKYRYTLCESCNQRTYVWVSDLTVKDLMVMQLEDPTEERQARILKIVGGLIRYVEEA